MPLSDPTISLISLGCPRTLVDSELYLGRLKQAGFQVVDSVEGSDVVIINTCGFVRDAVQESVDTILQAAELKRQGKLKVVIVAGCLVQRFKDELVNELPDVDGFIGVDGFGDIETVVQRAMQGHHTQRIRLRPRTMRLENDVTREPLTPFHYAYLKISEGCLKGCSFCVIPKIKGPLKSRPIEALVDEAIQLVNERGVRELILVGQDTSDYGVDLYGKPQIAELMRELAKIDGVCWIRLLYCHPRGVSRQLIHAMRDESKICKYLDMAVEHADDGVLQLMNRGMTQAKLRETIELLRREIPGIALRTSIIVGFPGETDAAFEQLIGFLREVRFERLGAFIYSNEEGSAAFRFPDQIPDAIKQERFHRVMTLQQDIAEAVNARIIGQTCNVLIDESDAKDPKQFVGRTSADCPEVDGVVFVRSDRQLSPGTFVPVVITDSYEYDLVGTADSA